MGGWNARAMWRDDGQLVSYMYYPGHNSPSGCGEDWKWGFQIQDDKMYTVHMYMKVNDPGSSQPAPISWLTLHRHVQRADHSEVMRQAFLQQAQFRVAMQCVCC
jgi:hypothetical protein